MQAEWTTVSNKKKAYKPPHLRSVENSQSASSFNKISVVSTDKKHNTSPHLKSGYEFNSKNSNYNKSHNNNKLYTGNGYNKSNNNKNFDGNKHKKKFVQIPDFESPEEQQRFEALHVEYPHIIMPGEIRRLAQKQNIDLLAEKMLSEEWIKYQQEGWKFIRVIKPDDDPENIPDGDDYDVKSLENKWGDIILFQRCEN